MAAHPGGPPGRPGRRPPPPGLTRADPGTRPGPTEGVSTQRITMKDGADGALPHHHERSAETFYVLDGAAEFLSGDQVITGEAGDLIVVPSRTAHAFAAVPGSDAGLLIVITPGVERFAYFRHLQRIALGELSPESILEVQERCDNHFLSSPAWHGRRR
ncbi:cupin domain-containing protein [Streptomyces xanthii]|uniref:Cupin domain-containing protein n=1 Tax=Streptomyces xanthii TaxID=2768069 RepID=A0A7H1BIT3_9ACTN|nr:cupin domain-containing protein [Streptomyces xanthii]